MPLGFAGLWSNFTDKEFFKKFLLHYQNFYVNCFTAFLDYGIDHLSMVTGLIIGLAI
jgi:hypothetical protein